MNYRWNNADKLVYNIPDDYEYGDIMPPVTLNPDGTLTTIEPDPDYSNRYRNNSFSGTSVSATRKSPKTQLSKQASHWCRRCQSRSTSTTPTKT